MAQKDRLTKFTIRQSLKALQDRRNFKTLDELAQAVEEDLSDEGFLLDVEDQAKIRKIVEEEGYTGRFAIDDWLRRRFKGSRLLPWLSLGAAVALFLISSVVGAKIEGIVQGPGTTTGNRQVTAVFQAPRSTSEHEVPFTIQLSNLGTEALSDLVVFVSGPGPVAEFHVDKLEPKQPRTLEGTFKLKASGEDSATLVAYVVAPGFSLKSEPVRVALEGQAVAALDFKANSFGASHEGAGMKRGKAQVQAPQAQAPQDQAPAAPAVTLEAAAPAQKGAVVSRQAPPSALKQVESDGEIQALAERCRSLPADSPERAANRQILQGFAAAGHTQASEVLKTL